METRVQYNISNMTSRVHRFIKIQSLVKAAIKSAKSGVFLTLCTDGRDDF